MYDIYWIQYLSQIEQILREMKFASDVILKFKSEKVYVHLHIPCIIFCWVDVGKPV